jgi:hypothetical protein
MPRRTHHQRPYVPWNSRGRRTAAVFFQDAKLAIAAGHGGLVAEPLAQVKGPLVLAGRLLIIPAPG